MDYRGKAKWIVRPAVSVLLRYGLALVSVAIALGLAQTFLYFHLPQPFTAFALSAIAITFWYGGSKPGILAALFSSLIRTYFFEPEINTVSRVLYDLVFLIFALLMTGVTRARNELEVRVTESRHMNDARKQGALPNPLPRAETQAILSPAATTPRDSEHTLILRTLEAVRWVIGGPKGAAAPLG